MQERTKSEEEDRGRTDSLTELLRTGAQKLLAQALKAEVADLLAAYQDQQDEQGHARVVLSGHQPTREIQTGIGPVTVQVPKVRSRQGDPVTFHSALVPPYVRKTASLEAAIPWLYLKGISTGEMQPALEALVGPEAKGLSASTVARLKQIWREEYVAWRKQRLDTNQWVYIWVDGIYSGLRAEQQRLCALVVIGMNASGEKQLLAMEDGIRESTQSWREVLLQLKARGLNAPALAVGDGALGFWAALEEIFPETRHQRCWCHKTQNVLNALPKSVHAKAKQALHEIWRSETKGLAEKAVDVFCDLLAERSRGTADVLCVSGGPLAKSAHHESHRIDVWDDSPSDSPHERMSHARWHVAHDVQVRPVCGETVAAVTRIQGVAQSRRGHSIY
jgi:transposase-like protein